MTWLSEPVEEGWHWYRGQGAEPTTGVSIVLLEPNGEHRFKVKFPAECVVIDPHNGPGEWLGPLELPVSSKHV